MQVAAAPLDDDEQVEPFTLLGTTTKKYVIEELQGEGVVGRQKGFTVDTCVSGRPASEAGRSGLTTRDKVDVSPLKECAKAEGEDLKSTCSRSCQQACQAALDRYAAASNRFTGFAIPSADKDRVQRSCLRSCRYECIKPGKAFDFAVSSRR